MNEEKISELIDSPDSGNNEQDVLEEILESENVPPDARKQIKKMVIEQSSFGMIGQMTQESALAKKILPEHITSYLDASKDNMQKGFQERRETKIFIFVLISIALVFFVILIDRLQSNPDLLEKIISGIIGLVAGAFGGYGVGRRKGSGD